MKNNKGFTIVEVCIVICVIVILSSVVLFTVKLVGPVFQVIKERQADTVLSTHSHVSVTPNIQTVTVKGQAYYMIPKGEYPEMFAEGEFFFLVPIK